MKPRLKAYITKIPSAIAICTKHPNTLLTVSGASSFTITYSSKILKYDVMLK